MMKPSTRTIRVALAAIAFLPCLAIAQDEETAPAEPVDYRPEKYSQLRYRNAISNSAFEREILPPEKPDAGPPPTPYDLSVVGVTGKSGNYRVTLIDTKKKYVVVTSDPKTNADGFYYKSVVPSSNIQEFKVEVAKEGQSQTEMAEFDTARFSIAAKTLAPPKKTNTKKRPSVVPTNRRPVPTRTPTAAQKAAAAKSGKEAVNAIEKANAAARAAGAEKSKSRVNGRRVVLPPKSR